MKFVFDIDDTILFSIVFENGSYSVESKNQPVIDKINELYRKGNQIVLWTARHWNHLINTERQLIEAGVKYHSLLMGKPFADYYIEDKAMKPDKFLDMEF